MQDSLEAIYRDLESILQRLQPFIASETQAKDEPARVPDTKEKPDGYKRLQTLLIAMGREKAITFLQSHGYRKLSDVPADQYDTLIAELEK